LLLRKPEAVCYHFVSSCLSILISLCAVQGALEWLEQNQDKTMEEIAAANNPETDASIEPPALKDGEVAKSMKCNDCGKKFRSMAQAEFHAEKTYVKSNMAVCSAC
jgi:hypothetical protein